MESDRRAAEMQKEIDRERVIKGLEICSAGREHAPNDRDCTSCPYYPAGYTGCTSKPLITDALALLKEQENEIQKWQTRWQRQRYTIAELLKAQEPRVMTFDEIVAAAPGTVVWLEDYDKTDVIAGLVKKVYIYTKVIDFLIVNEKVNDEVTADLDAYSEGWRCWTSRPNEKRRAETPWDAQEQRDYEAAVEMAEYCERYEPTYNADDGSM